jgi:arsenate reductase
MLTLYHNPGCSKSREALALLQQRGLPIEIREYLNNPLDLAQLQALRQILNVPAREMLRSSEAVYEELGLADESLSDDQLLAAVAAHPVLLQRPIAVDADRALIARPPELLLGLFPQAL